MGQLTAGEARSRVSTYVRELDSLTRSLQKNFNDMDFENADKRVDMEEIIDGMIKDCNTVKRALEDLCFEE